MRRSIPAVAIFGYTSDIMNFNQPKNIFSVNSVLGLSLFLAPCLALTLGGCHWRNPKVGQVGNSIIYQSDVDCRDAIIKLNYANDERKLGLQQLIHAYQYAQILKNHGHEVTRETLTAESKRISERTLFPDKLAQIQKACGGDGETYIRAYVLPVFVERFLYFDFFLKNPVVQAPSLEAPNQFLVQALLNPSSFAKLAKQRGYEVGQLRVSLSKGLEWQQTQTRKNQPLPISSAPAAVSQRLDVQKDSQSSAEGKKWIEEIITPLKPGTVSPRIIDIQEAWLVVKYLKPKTADKSSYGLEAVAFPKRNFDEWLAGEVKLLPVQ